MFVTYQFLNFDEIFVEVIAVLNSKQLQSAMQQTGASLEEILFFRDSYLYLPPRFTLAK